MFLVLRTSHYLFNHLKISVFLISEIYSQYNNFHTPQARSEFRVLYMLISYDVQALQKPTILSSRFLNCQNNRYLSECFSVFSLGDVERVCYCVMMPGSGCRPVQRLRAAEALFCFCCTITYTRLRYLDRLQIAGR